MATNRKTRPRHKTTRRSGPRTLTIDIGGSGIKAIVLNHKGTPVTKRRRHPTPRTPRPRAVVDAICGLIPAHVKFDRVSVGFPGVVTRGAVYTAVNLHPDWVGFDLARTLQRKLRKPVRVANDADIQGYGAIEGVGVELVLTLGTGLGSALFVDGYLVPNLELAHHPFRKAETYEEQVGRAALDVIGRRRWNRRVLLMLDLLGRIINYRKAYLGGGNARKLEGPLPRNVRIVSNEAGLLGGIALWRKS